MNQEKLRQKKYIEEWNFLKKRLKKSMKCTRKSFFKIVSKKD
jgi:hypothetical protein